MRILYGVAGEGLGHAIRSQAVLEHLVACGHDVAVMASGRAYEVLAKRFANVHRIQGLFLAYDQERMSVGRTLLGNALQLVPGLRHNLSVSMGLATGTGGSVRGMAPGRDIVQRLPFAPDIVLTDFETWSLLYAHVSGVPVVSIDNLQVIHRCKQPKDIVKGQRKAFELARTVVRAKQPGADHYVITSFFPAKVRKKHTTVVPPVLRASVLQARCTRGEHVLVYRSGGDDGRLEEVLRAFPDTEFRIYGTPHGRDRDVRQDNLLYRPVSEEQFVADLASSRAVIAGGGFTLMSEAIYLGKPMLSVPIPGHFEQNMNARWLERLGYGLQTEKLRKRDVRTLLEQGDEFAHALRDHRQCGNADAFEVISDVIERLVR